MVQTGFKELGKSQTTQFAEGDLALQHTSPVTDEMKSFSRRQDLKSFKKTTFPAAHRTIPE